MKTIKALLASLVLLGTLSVSTTSFSAAGGLIEGKFLSKVQAPGSNSCHLRFPAIHEDTLFTDHPVLQDATTNDIIDFYGSCDHDPLGKDEVRQQRDQYYKYLFEDF